MVITSPRAIRHGAGRSKELTIPSMPTRSSYSPVPRSAGGMPEAVIESGQTLGGPGSQLRPRQVTWEMIQACNWQAKSTRRRASSRRDRSEFSTAEAFHLVEQVAAMHVPLLALTGGDPLLRPDLFPVIEFASNHSVRTSLTLLPTHRLNPEVILQLKMSGLMRAGFWLHGSTAALNNAVWVVSGCYPRTLELIRSCHEVGLPVQINTVLSRRNLHDLDWMIALLTRLDVALWNLCFFVPTNPEELGEMLTADEHEQVFTRLHRASKVTHFQIRTTEGQPYQRYALHQRVRESRGRKTEAEFITLGPSGVNESNGFIFISHDGEAYPSRFLPLSAGNVTTQSLAEVYGDSPLFLSLRDSSKLKGKCGRCKFRDVCGGSRARAYATTGDLFAADPACAYEP